jgi:DNA-binding response OmpR family regulator
MTYNNEPRDSISILIIEDQRNWQEVFVDILSHDGYVIDIASNLSEALFKLEKHQYKVAIIDLRLIEDYLFGYQGFSIINIAKEKGAKTIICTGFGSPKLKSLLINEFNVDGYIEKSPRFRNSKLRMIVKKLARLE